MRRFLLRTADDGRRRKLWSRKNRSSVNTSSSVSSSTNGLREQQDREQQQDLQRKFSENEPPPLRSPKQPLTPWGRPTWLSSRVALRLLLSVLIFTFLNWPLAAEFSLQGFVVALSCIALGFRILSLLGV
eukprot:TRINITY_DN1229_c1_g2_i1.p1 TRINITY_DN1229_c1_g2~~TRINITY_DN1229_c1_g2_i1.p1  ORF type:complete len:130 (+),score=20.80 TRINITY_DN1229_c1_g2_i1:233-622(+)